MKEIILVKDGELALKGLNRSTFEDILVKNMRRRLSPLGKFAFTKSQSTVMIEPLEEGIDLDEAAGRLTRVFGIAGFSRAAQAPKEMGEILRIAGEYLAPQLMEAASFKVEAKRSDKKFPLKSPQISADVYKRQLWWRSTRFYRLARRISSRLRSIIATIRPFRPASRRMAWIFYIMAGYTEMLR